MNSTLKYSAVIFALVISSQAFALTTKSETNLAPSDCLQKSQLDAQDTDSLLTDKEIAHTAPTGSRVDAKGNLIYDIQIIHAKETQATKYSVKVSPKSCDLISID